MNKKRFELIIVILTLAIVYNFHLSLSLNLLGKENVITSADGYFYALLAKLLTKDIYTSINYLKNVPSFYINPFPVPLNSYIAYLLNKFFSIKLEDTFLFLSMILAPLFSIPFYFFFRKFLPFWAILSGVLIGNLNLIYFDRNKAGRFDTDSLILFFVFTIYILMFKLLENIKDLKNTILYSILIVISINLFMWWYYKPIFISLFFISFFIGMLLFYKKDIFKYSLNISVFISIYVFSNLKVFIDSFFMPFRYIFSYFFKINTPFMPESILKYIEELQGLAFSEFVMIFTDNILTTLIGIIGFLIIIVKYYKYILPMSPIILIGLLSFKSGNRFFIYLAPFLGLGIGYFLWLIYVFTKNKIKVLNKSLYYYLLTILVIILSIPTSIGLVKANPYVSDDTYKSIKAIREKLEKNSFLWTDINFGGVFQFITEKSTYIDPSTFPIQKVFLFSFSLISPHLEESYKTISFATNNYNHQYFKIPQYKLSKIIKNYNNKPRNIVYFPFYENLLYLYPLHRIGIYGNPTVKNFTLPMVKAFTKCKKLKDTIDCKLIKLSYNKSILHIDYGSLKKVNVEFIEFIDRQNRIYKEIYRNILVDDSKEKLVFEIIKNNEDYFMLLSNEIIYNSTLNKLYIKNVKNKYFENIYDNFPTLVVFKLKN